MFVGRQVRDCALHPPPGGRQELAPSALRSPAARAQAWDPALICKQIVAMQFLFYAGLASLQVVFIGACPTRQTARERKKRDAFAPVGRPTPFSLFSREISDASSPHVTRVVPFAPWSPLDHLLSWRRVNTITFVNMMVCLSLLFNACLCALALRLVVARTKRCWDFGATVYIVHLAVASALRGFPFSWLWWMLVATCAIVTVLLGELLCARFEMADIPVQGGGALALDLRWTAPRSADSQTRCTPSHQRQRATDVPLAAQEKAHVHGIGPIGYHSSISARLRASSFHTSARRVLAPRHCTCPHVFSVECGALSDDALAPQARACDAALAGLAAALQRMACCAGHADGGSASLATSLPFTRHIKPQ